VSKAEILNSCYPPGNDETLSISLEKEHHPVPNHKGAVLNKESNALPANSLSPGPSETFGVLCKFSDQVFQVFLLRFQEVELQAPGKDKAFSVPHGSLQGEEVPFPTLGKVPGLCLYGEVGELVGNEHFLSRFEGRSVEGENNNGLFLFAFPNSSRVSLFFPFPDPSHHHLKTRKEGHLFAFQGR
jgi:hypothetical protein